MSAPSLTHARFWVRGTVQGVGFRPHVHRLATSLGLSGSVRNDPGGVRIDVAGPVADIDAFRRRLVDEAPPLADVADVIDEPVPGGAPTPVDGFRIEHSDSAAGAARTTGAPPDTATCPACLAQMADPGDRRFRHPFITCTDCGPRFTIIQRLPYDRPATTMAAFPLCAACDREYHDPGNRRFHAQPIACHDCGPGLWWTTSTGRIGGRGLAASDAAIGHAQRALRDGQIVAVKGVGGYHLACRPDDEATVGRLRQRKQRPGKPFALLARDLEVIRRVAHVDADEERALTSPAAPIVLLRRRDGAALAATIAPGNPLLGVMVASNPLHRLLLEPSPGTGDPVLDLLVLTSGNRSEEPICIDDDDAQQRLAGIADAFLVHDRPIAVPCDDSVVRVMDGQTVVLRRSRGYVPTAVRLPMAGVPALGLGAQLKATVCLTDGEQAWLSQHIGDMGSLPALRSFERTIERTRTMHEVVPEVLACDAHPDHTAHGWARRHADGLPVVPVQHHHAHVASLMVEHGLAGPVIGVAFDGTGYGTDPSGAAEIWGGEVLVADLRTVRRAAHLSLAPLPGGDAAIRHPRRVALAHLRAAGVEWAEDLLPVAVTTLDERRILATQIQRGFNTVPTSSMGRLFDAVSSLVGVRHDITFEAQAAIELEIRADAHRQRGGTPAPLTLPLRIAGDDQPAQLDAAALIRDLVDLIRAGADVGAIALGFHVAVADAIVAAARHVAGGQDPALHDVCLTGGVFANALLLSLTAAGLREAGLIPRTHRMVPPNDGGISLGQAAIAACAVTTPPQEERTTPCA